LPEEFIERCVRLAIDVRDERIVVILVKSAKKISHQLVVVKRLANSCQFRGKSLHLGEVIIGTQG
jgi:competence transcription factor ComK